MATSAFAALDMDQLAELVNAGRAQEAYSLASQYLRAHEGEPKFDFYFGLAAIDSGHLSEGVFALQRVVMLYPENDRARLELARGYYLIGEDARARQEFERVLRHNPPAQVKANIQRFLDRIRLREGRYTTTARAYVELGAGFDTNVNSAPSDANFFSPLLGLQSLPESAQEKGDAFGSLAVGGQFTHPVTPGSAITGGVDLQTNANRTYSQYDTGAATGRIGGRWMRDDNRYDLTLLGQRFDVAHKQNRELVGFSGQWTHTYTPRQQLNSYVSAVKLHYPGQTVRDSRQYTLGTGVVNMVPGRWSPVWFGSIYVGQEEAKERTNAALAIADRRFTGGRIGGQFTLAPTLSLTTSLTAQFSNYRGTNEIFVTRRKDNFGSFDLLFNWLLAKRWSANMDLSYSRNDSNISLYRYNRARGSVSLRYEY